MEIVLGIYLLFYLQWEKIEDTSFVLLKMNRKWKYNRYTQWNIINCKKWNYKIFMTMHKTDNIIISEITQVLKDKCWIFSFTCTLYFLFVFMCIYMRVKWRNEIIRELMRGEKNAWKGKVCVLVSFPSTEHKLGSFGKMETQLRKFSLWVGLWAC